MSRARGEIMYLERKDGLSGPAWIGRVHRSKSGRTLYYRHHRFVSMRGLGYKAIQIRTTIWEILFFKTITPKQY